MPKEMGCETISFCLLWVLTDTRPGGFDFQKKDKDGRQVHQVCHETEEIHYGQG
jgi:hypothetical protein